MTLRRAVASDALAVHALEQVLFGVDAWSTRTVRQSLTSPLGHAIVAARVDGTEGVDGYAITSGSGEVVDLDRIGVRPTYRRAGVGRALLGHVLARAVAEGATRMMLEVSAANEGARAFYAATGFVEVARRRRYFRDGSDALVLARDLSVRGD